MAPTHAHTHPLNQPFGFVYFAYNKLNAGLFVYFCWCCCCCCSFVCWRFFFAAQLNALSLDDEITVRFATLFHTHIHYTLLSTIFPSLFCFLFFRKSFLWWNLFALFLLLLFFQFIPRSSLSSILFLFIQFYFTFFFIT